GTLQENPVVKVRVRRGGPEKGGCGGVCLSPPRRSCEMNGATRGHRWAAGKTAETELYCRSITADHSYVCRPDADLIGSDLREHCLEALPHCHCSRDDREPPPAAHANNGPLKRPTPPAL